MAVWVKICGITNVDDARAGWDAGADAIGLNFVAGPRRIALAQAPAILEATPTERTAVALVQIGPEGVDPVLGEMLSAHGVTHLQIYDPIDPSRSPSPPLPLSPSAVSGVAVLANAGWQPVVVCRTVPGRLAESLAPWIHGPAATALFGILLDAHDPSRAGGTGKTLDWNEVAQFASDSARKDIPRLILAGGLIPGNVQRAVQVAHPWGVDVSSGVEREPGHKDHRAVAAFVRAAKAAS